LREAVMDPNVLAIKQTIYRAGSDTTMMDLLREAVRRGKEVTAVVELKARFDEEANINWAEQLESIGAQVVYGIVGLKTHAKMLLVTRREGRVLRRYGHLSTGNYNRRTAALKMKRLLVAPFNLHAQMQARIEAVGDAAARGAHGRIVIKMNALTDAPLMEALLAAGKKGAKIDLIVRGACMLPAGVAGLSDNIRVRSVIGRFLEHSRVFYFCADQDESLYLSSADWMTRNMTRRIELAWPVTDPLLRQRIIDECLIAYLHDARDAWDLAPDGHYHRVGLTAPGPGAQQALMQRYDASPVQE
jgi:polyphosphate kinase